MVKPFVENDLKEIAQRDAFHRLANHERILHLNGPDQGAGSPGEAGSAGG